MTNQADSPAQARPLDILGISEPEERVYRWLLTHPPSVAIEAGRALGLSVSRMQNLLDRIETKGLATHSPERPRRYIPVSPDVALEAFALRRQEELRHARAAIRELQEQAVAVHPRRGRKQMVELIISDEAKHQTFEQMHRSAREEVIALTRPPLLISRLELAPSEDQRTQRAAQARGVRYRGIVDAAFLGLPGAITTVRDEIESGQDMRVIPEAPFKVIAADHRIAFIPLSLEQPGSPVLLVRSSALLDALYALFEILWKQAAPITFSSRGELQRGEAESEWPRGADELISLLAAGLNDKRIAHEMGISASTLNRRITETMKVLGARTRFQLGWLADRYLSEQPERKKS